MKQYKFLNTISGWIVFLIASTVYILTSEPTASYWDCGEYISTAYKLQVGHPPGAPLFQLLGRFFSLFAFGDVTLVARMINTMSALASGFTILFLFWTITALAKKIVFNSGEIKTHQLITVLGAGFVGAMAYTFSDSFWFSAVEGEVYAMSSFFTAITFWAILKWEEVADEPYADRWIVFIAFMTGLSIGVHLLNLLCIPAMTMVYYYRKIAPSKRNFTLALILSIIILGFVQAGIIPWTVKLAGLFELFFVNTAGLPFNSGTIIYAVFLIGLVVLGLIFSKKRGKTVLNTVVLSFAFILIGYSSFLVLVVRSNANTPINENAPKDAISLLGYLNREQYGDWPLLYGPYFNAPLDSEEPFIDGKPLYARDDAAKKYVVVDERKLSVYNYDKRFYTIFPRMWSSSSDLHGRGYQTWSKMDGTPITITNRNGTKEEINKPTFIENLRFFFTYQVGHMYLRYFMWNFSGRQNDQQGHGGLLNGNWMTGIKFIDQNRLGPQENLPETFTGNAGRNYFFMLPLLLGLLGFFIQLNKEFKGFLVITLLFVFTGFAINVYLNPVPYQPRERDYAYAASFYAFAIWIGFGVIGVNLLFQKIKKFINPAILSVAAVLLCLLLVPALMAKEGWNDHDRSKRYTTIDIASDYLNSCAPNAILFTLGDNDTFPLWYAQEVEGIRRDVRIVNLSLLNMDWYIDQMKHKVYDSEPLPITMDKKKYIASKRDFVFIYEDTNLVKPDTYFNIKALVDFATNDDESLKLSTSRGKLNYFPTRKFLLPVDTALVLKNGTVSPEYADSVQPQVYWDYNDHVVMKNNLVVLNMLSELNWKRPVYFATTTGDDAYLNLLDYLQLEGLAYRFVPYRCHPIDSQTGRVHTGIMYENMMNKFKYGNMNHPGINLDETSMRMTNTLRNLFSRLATALLYEGKSEKALKVCDKCIEVMPDNTVPYNHMLLPIITAYYKCGQYDKANGIAQRLGEYCEQELNYFAQFSGTNAVYIRMEKDESLDLLDKLIQIAKTYGQKTMEKQLTGSYQHFKS
ncbi:MAG TPA: DUF2723 domain-containing protein [Bacteroidales bacterium]|nr:DUF2723 domain-containing protein [Bacteroidales bacterium]